MKRRALSILLAVFVLALASLACEASFSTAKISDAFMTNDENAAAKTSLFAQDDVFYCVVQLSGAPDDTKLKAVWTAVEVEGEAPNTFLYEKEYVGGASSVTFDLSNSQLWPPGKYKVDLYLNDQLDRTLEFAVASPVQ